MKRVVSAEGLIKKDVPYLLMWVLYYACVVVFTTWWTATPSNSQTFTADIRSVIHGCNLLSSAIYICFYKKQWFVKTAQVGAAVLLCGITVFLFALPAGAQLYMAPAVGAMLGLVNVSLLIPYVFVMNNTEKFYGMLFAFVVVNLFSLLYQPAWIGSLGERLASLAVLAAALPAVAWFRQDDLAGYEAALPTAAVRRIAHFSLVINCFFAIFIKGVGKIMLDSISGAAQPNAYLWHFAGGLLGCAVYWFVFARVQGSLFTVWNITFSAFLLAAVCYAFAPSVPAAGIPVAVFTGCSGTIGMITLYYNMGVNGRKFRNMNHLKLCLWFGVIGGGGSVLLGNLLGAMPRGTAVMALTAVSVAASLAYFVAFPFLQRTYFRDGWVSDSETTATDGRLAGMIHRYGLTTREAQICHLLRDGRTIRQVAGELRIAQSTVNMHTSNLYRKLGINSRIELVRLMEEIK